MQGKGMLLPEIIQDKKNEYTGGKNLSCVQNKKRQKALSSFVTVIWVGLVMNK